MNELSINIDIDSIAIETDVERWQLPGASQKVEEAFRLLQIKIRQLPLDQLLAKKIWYDQITINELSMDELLGDRGAERLAELLYQEVLKL